MKQSLERKINAHRQAKATKQSFEGFMQQKKKALKFLMQQQALQQSPSLLQFEKQNKYSSTNEFNKRLQIKEQEYFRQMEEIQRLKLEGIEKLTTLENLKIDVGFQRDAYQQLQETVKRQREQGQHIIDQIAQKQNDQFKKTIEVYKDRQKANLEHMQQLLNAKEQQNQVIMNFLNKKKKFQKEQKELKENHEKSLKENKKLWAQQEQESREKWEKQKKQQTMQNTLKGIEPQIQRIISSSKAEIKKVQQKYEILKQQYRLSLTKQYQKRATELRSQSFAVIEQQKSKILQQASQKLTLQFQTLEQQFQKDRKKIRAQREQQIRQLQQKRKNQTQEFIINNKDFYTIHLQQVKAIKEEYERQIRELEGSCQGEVEKQEHNIRVKYNEKLQKEREVKRKELQQRIKKFTIQYEKESQSMYEDLVERVAVDNDLYESQVRARAQHKIKDMREEHEAQVKKLKKTVQVLQAKLAMLNKQAINKREERQQAEQALEEIKREHQYLQRKVTDYEQDLLQRKLNLQTNNDLDNHPSILSLTQQWQQQITKAKQSYLALEKQVQQSQQIMAQKIAQLRTDYSENVNLLEKNSLKLLTMKKNELAKLKADKEMQEKYGEGLEEMIKKQKLMMEKFEEKQRAFANGVRRPPVQN